MTIRALKPFNDRMDGMKRRETKDVFTAEEKWGIELIARGFAEEVKRKPKQEQETE
jgi:hypothetical protein